MFEHYRSKGFSLVELLLALAILAIISGIAIPSFLGQRSRARLIGDAKSNVKVLQMALEERKAHLGLYGAPDEYKYYTSPPERPDQDSDPAPGFEPAGNSKLNFDVTIGETGLTYSISVKDPQKSADTVILYADHTGAMIEPTAPSK